MNSIRGHVNLLLVLLVLLCSAASLELLDLGGDVGLALGVSKFLGLVLERFRLPVGSLLGGLERRIFTDGSMGIGVDLLNIVRANTISKIGGELFLEAGALLAKWPSA
jgi:hypothetical protein